MTPDPATAEDPEPGSPVRGISRNVFILGITSFLTDLSSEIVYPLVPLFLTGVLGAPFAVVGLIEGIAESTASTLKVFSGWLSDRWRRRRPLTILGYGISRRRQTAAGGGHRLAAGPRPAVRRPAGQGNPQWRPRDALIADSTDAASRGRVFGFHRAADTAGAALGALAGPGGAGPDRRALPHHLSHLGHPGASWAWSASSSSASALHTHRTAERPRLSLSQFDRKFKMFLLASAIFALGNSSDAFLILRARDLGLSAFAAVLGLRHLQPRLRRPVDAGGLAFGPHRPPPR